MHYMALRSFQMQKHKFGVTFPGAYESHFHPWWMLEIGAGVRRP
jgi:hypothetical protein